MPCFRSCQQFLDVLSLWLAWIIWYRICEGLVHTTRSKSMRRDLSLVNSCSSLHFPLAAGLLGVLARELVSDFGVDMARPDCSATLAELAAARLGHYYKKSVNKKVKKQMRSLPRTSWFCRTGLRYRLRVSLPRSHSHGKTKERALSFRTRKQRFQDGQVHADCKARW